MTKELKQHIEDELQLTDMEAIDYLFTSYKEIASISLFDIVNAIAKKFPSWNVEVIANSIVKRGIAINHKYGSLVYDDKNKYFQLYDKIKKQIKGNMFYIIPSLIALMEIEDEYTNNR